MEFLTIDKIALRYQVVLTVFLNTLTALILSTKNDSLKISVSLKFKDEFRGSFDYEIYEYLYEK